MQRFWQKVSIYVNISVNSTKSLVFHRSEPFYNILFVVFIDKIPASIAKRLSSPTNHIGTTVEALVSDHLGKKWS